ncbi:MAG: site-2 protease family protein [Propionibacteriaceae bacterium]|jgi:membrane-associated protease RseP (regulator of RpoE activity)|nr:site-2 protease family protein [Propionibacteriaceae bacterium]
MVWEIVAGLAFFALIMVSVGLHELGHFIPSKLFGVKVRQFFLGFGPNLWKTQRGETEYGVKAFPLGGYCAIVGMLPPYKEGKDTRLKRFADNIREADWQFITDADVAGHRLFYQQSFPKRLLIMAGGVGINLVLAFALFLGVNLTYGKYDYDLRTTTVGAVYGCPEQAVGPCEQTPAQAMGLQVGDAIVAFNGVRYATYEELTAAVRANVETAADGTVTAAKADTVTVNRPGVGEVTLPTVPGLLVTVETTDEPPVSVTYAYLGLTYQYARVHPGPWATLKQMGSLTWISLQAIAKLPVSAWDTVTDLITGTPRDESGVMSVVGASRIAGEVAATDQLDASSKWALYISLLASINLFVGLLNLVPLLPFDGGHVAAGLYGVIRSRWAKLRGKADPGPVDAAKLQPIAYIVGGFLIVLGAILILADVIAPITLF